MTKPSELKEGEKVAFITNGGTVASFERDYGVIDLIIGPSTQTEEEAEENSGSFVYIRFGDGGIPEEIADRICQQFADHEKFHKADDKTPPYMKLVK